MMGYSSDAEQCTPAQTLFFQQLRDMINSEAAHTGCVRWTDDGKGFNIVSKKTFEAALPKYFGQVKYQSFTRRLKRWGFRRSFHAGPYVHGDFQRDAVFDVDVEDDSQSTGTCPPSPGSLPLKKRSLSQHATQVQAVNKQSDVAVLPELLRSINRLKRKEKQNKSVHTPPAKKRKSILASDVTAAQVLASLSSPVSMQDNQLRIPKRNEDLFHFRRMVADSQTQNVRLPNRFDPNRYMRGQEPSFAHRGLSNPGPMQNDQLRIPKQDEDLLHFRRMVADSQTQNVRLPNRFDLNNRYMHGQELLFSANRSNVDNSFQGTCQPTFDSRSAAPTSVLTRRLPLTFDEMIRPAPCPDARSSYTYHR